MNTLTRADFAAFFAEVNGGHAPFAWQQRLFDHLMEHGRWPDQIAAPTGSGKSSVVEIHVMAVALSALGQAPRLPRRLAVVVGRRALVDSQADRAEAIRDWLSSGSALASAMSAALRGLVDGEGDPLRLVHLRGGIPVSRRWVDEPRACTIVCATPDMYGSSLLFRGYGTGRRARPREAGLLALDCALVLDEAHLSRQLLATARKIAELGNGHAALIGVPGLQVVDTTATPDPSAVGSTVAVTDEDMASDSVLRVRLCRPKPVRYVSIDAWAGPRQPAKYIAAVAAETRRLRSEVSGGTVCCVVNNVSTAVRLAKELNAPCWVGRLRPYDLDQLRRRFPALFGLPQREDAEVPSVIVATQTIEVGVDADFSGMLTELAPGTALAQRAGRVNRRGEREDGPFVVVGPQADQIAEQLPYRRDDLAAAHSWLGSLDAAAGISPAAIVQAPPPGASPERLQIKRPQPYDVDRWVQTTDDLLAEEDLELWLRDCLEEDDAVAGIVVRDNLPADDSIALDLLRAVPPTPAETFPVTTALARHHADLIVNGGGECARVFLERDGDVTQLDPQADRVRSGDVMVVDTGHTLTDSGVVTWDPADQPAAVPDDGRVVVLPGHPEDGWLPTLAGRGASAAQELVRDAGLRFQVLLPTATEDALVLPWVVFLPLAEVAEDEDLQQEWTRNEGVVTLSEHQGAVGHRARAIGAGLGLSEQLCRVLAAAGLHHDDGKRDVRFQRERLGNDGGPPLAKSRVVSSQQVRRNRARSALPIGWRHEMLSVVVAWDDLSDCGDPDLAARLIGTSHGHGRSLPPNSATELVFDSANPDHERAVWLFDEGEWTSLMERTTGRWGAWGSAFLEALLRAADCQVSKEGS